MKLTKDQIQKLVLGIMMMCGLIYAFFEFLLTPLNISREAALKKAADLDPQILQARTQIAKTGALEAEGPKTKETIGQVMAMIPEGSPVAWFPPRMADFFRQRGIERVSTRMNNEMAEELPGLRRLNWGIELPRADFMSFAAAVAELENSEPLLEIQSLEIDAGREDVGAQRVILNVNNLVRL